MDKKVVYISSPLSGTFYMRPYPEEPPYVELGDEITPGTIVCLIESMKVFNELRSEINGIIKKILVENEDSILIGQHLFEVEVS